METINDLLELILIFNNVRVVLFSKLQDRILVLILNNGILTSEGNQNADIKAPIHDNPERSL